MPAMREPLKELPLESFMPRGHKKPLKRPLSPSSALLSPSKRRILEVEGHLSPEKRRRHTPSRSIFPELSQTPRSPGRKLDFTAMKNVVAQPVEQDAPPRPVTPVSNASKVSKLQPSPEIKSFATSCASSNKDDEDEPMALPPLPEPVVRGIRIPREVPVIDRNSIHYPGFDTYIDPYIEIPTAESVARLKVDEQLDTEETKENVPSKRRVKSPLSPGGKAVKFSRASETPNIMSLLSPRKAPMSPQQRDEQRKQGKIALLREVNDNDGDEECDVDQQL